MVNQTIRQNSPGAFLGPMPNGDTQRSGKGGDAKGLKTHPSLTSFAILSLTTCSIPRTNFKLFARKACLGPLAGIQKPSVNQAHRYPASTLLGYLSKSSLITFSFRGLDPLSV